MSKIKIRLDILLTERKLFLTRNLAQAAIMEGRVLVNEQKIEKAGQLVPADAEIRIIGEDLPYVSRGGLKLEGALKHFKTDVTELRCLDVGASTGGFTDCLLQHGASKVVALDVGKGQLHEKLRQDPRVEIIDGVNAREITDDYFDEPFDLITIDVSFISQKLIVPALMPHLKSGGMIIALVKPQFEAGRDKIGKGGIVRDENVRKEVVEDIKLFYISLGFNVLGVIESHIQGHDGNVEYLIVAVKQD
jgi:23S rRNA (cytidine1920-2'-O)/16S rRNA (cytidine1409-2'-O)-methyltransferase